MRLDGEQKQQVVEIVHTEVDEIVSESVRQTLIQLGISIDNPMEMQKDMQYLREWRESTTSIRQKSVMVVMGIAISGLLSLIWVGFKNL